MGLHLQILALASAAIGVRWPGLPVPPRPASFVGTSPDALPMVSAPIEPSWILDGAPEARVSSHSKAADRLAETAVWDCTAGTFRWFFGWDETVVILEGAVRVTADDGTVTDLRPGDVGYFKADTWATWQIDDYVRKIAFMRRPVLAPIAFAYRVESALRHRAKRALSRAA